jgi:ribosomal protein S18 acetylase RimI-like enzyme
MDEAAETLLADYQHRKLFVEDEATGAAVRGYFEERGWMTSHDAMMLRVGPPPPMPQGVREVTLEATRALRRQWYGPSQADHIAVSEPYAVRRGTRALMAGEEGFAWFVPGEIDQLYVSETARGRGLGTALMAAAMQGSDRWWIVAGEGEPAQALYERLGFTTVWRPYGFTRKPPT